MRKWVIALIVLSVFVIACTSNDDVPLPGELTSIPLVGMAYQASSFTNAYGSVYDVKNPSYNSINPNLMLFSISSSNAINFETYGVQRGQPFILDISLTLNDPQGKIYEKAFVTNANNQWREFPFSGLYSRDSQGFITGSNAYLRVQLDSSAGSNDLNFGGYNYVAAYACKKYNDGTKDVYRCGCSSGTDTICNKFMIHYFKVCDTTFNDAACVPNSGCNPACSPCTGTKTRTNGCGQQTVEQCTVPATAPCQAGQSCVNGACSGCTPGEKRCATNNGPLQRCDNGLWVVERSSCGFLGCYFNSDPNVNNWVC